MQELEQYHQETLRVCIRDYFALFLPELLTVLKFESAHLIEKEFDAGFRETAVLSDTDILGLIELKQDEIAKELILYWAHWSIKPPDFKKKMFYFYCKLCFQYELPVLPVILYTGPAEQGEPQWEQCNTGLGEYIIMPFQFPVIKLKNYSAKEFMEKQQENPLTWVYLPFTSYSPEQRPDIFALSLRGIAACIDPEDREKMNTLVELVELGMQLTPAEKKLVDLIFRKPEFKEARMLHSLRENGIREGLTKGRSEGRQTAAIEHTRALLKNGVDWDVITNSIGIKPEDLEKDQANITENVDSSS